MLKRRVNEAEIDITISPVTPLLIRGSEAAGLDPTRPEIEFVRTWRGAPSPYIPGSTLKGAIRSHAERIIRTIGGKDRARRPWACDPLMAEAPCRRVKGPEPEKYQNLCNACRIFGSSEFASRLSITDAYPQDLAAVVCEERSSVSIDRVLGSAVGAPTTYEVVAAGTFTATLRLVNFSLEQLGLLGLVLRDIDRRQVGLGAGKTRGLGQVSLSINSVRIRYPGCELENGIWCRPLAKTFEKTDVLGAGMLFRDFAEYGYPGEDSFAQGIEAGADEIGIGVVQQFSGEALDALWRGCVVAWKKQMSVAVAARPKGPRKESGTGEHARPRRQDGPPGQGGRRDRDGGRRERGGRRTEGAPAEETTKDTSDESTSVVSEAQDQLDEQVIEQRSTPTFDGDRTESETHTEAESIASAPAPEESGDSQTGDAQSE